MIGETIETTGSREKERVKQDAPQRAILKVDRLVKQFTVGGRGFGRRAETLKALDEVSFTLAPGETLGLVGESGCGKTTLGRVILRLTERTAGRVIFDGIDLFDLSARAMRTLRGRMQIIFQDPFSSLNPRFTVEATVTEGMRIFGLASGRGLRDRVVAMIEKVGLSADALDRYPHEFSGGQRQRVGIARALSVEPDFVVCDEPVSALDVSVQAQVINLLIDLRDEMGLSYLFISHDLSVVKHISDRVAVMYLGKIVEIGAVAALFANPRHPYTRALISAVPVPEPGGRRKRIILEGDVPSPIDPPPGCAFHPRCPRAQPECAVQEPPLKRPDDQTMYRCVL